MSKVKVKPKEEFALAEAAESWVETDNKVLVAVSMLC